MNDFSTRYINALQAGLHQGMALETRRHENALAPLREQLLQSQVDNSRAAGARSAKEFEMRVAQHAASLDAAQAAKDAEEIRKGIFAASTAATPEQWDDVARRFGQPALVGQFGQKDALLSQFMTAAQILERQAGAAPLSSLGRIQADIDAGLLPEGTPLRANTPLVQIGTTGAKGGTPVPPKMTVDAGKNTGFLIRLNDANEVLNSLEGQGTRFGQQNADLIPLGLGNFLRDPEFQKFDQARRDFVNAVLRRESGAVISEQEFANADQQYFPVPGDSPEVIAQKRQNRINAIAGVRAGAGAGAAYVDQLQATGTPDSQASSVPDFSAMSDEQLEQYISEHSNE